MTSTTDQLIHNMLKLELRVRQLAPEAIVNQELTLSTRDGKYLKNTRPSSNPFS